MMGRVWLIVVLVGACWAQVKAQGRSFPMAAEEDTVAKFKAINPNLEYDKTNFLVDLSGQYASCDNTQRGFYEIDLKTYEDETIQGILDWGSGTESHVLAVISYIRQTIDSWVDNPAYVEQINGATKFGCSVRPGCRNRRGYAVACLFSPAAGGFEPENFVNPGAAGAVKALAFTRDQYSLAQDITGHFWDDDHFLENLSGMETNCAMIGKRDWAWTKMHEMEEALEIRLTGVFGSAPNTGDTERALRTILQSLKEVRPADEIGCSLIPDCMFGRGRGRMYVVASCIYNEV